MATRLLNVRSVTNCGTPHPCEAFAIDCGIGGTCVTGYPPSLKSTYCLCGPGFVSTNSTCRPNSDVCQKGHLECSNGGMCSFDGKQAKCSCRPLFTGRQCENDVADKCLQKIDGRPLNKCVRHEYCRYNAQTNNVRCKCPIGRIGSRCDQGDSTLTTVD